MLESDTSNKTTAFDIYEAYKNLSKTPLGTILNFGFVKDNGTCCRTKCYISDPKVILYALFKLTENCRYLANKSEHFKIDQGNIFGLDNTGFISYIKYLSKKYPNFISYPASHCDNDLKTIILVEDKGTIDVLNLFMSEPQSV